LSVLQAKQMNIALEQTEQLVRVAFDEQPESLCWLVVHHAEGARVAPGAQHGDMRPE